MVGKSWQTDLAGKSLERTWRRQFERQRTDFRYRNGQRLIGPPKWTTCEPMKLPGRPFFPGTGRRKLGKYFAIRNWPGRCSKLRSMAGMRFTGVKSQRRF